MEETTTGSCVYLYPGLKKYAIFMVPVTWWEVANEEDTWRAGDEENRGRNSESVTPAEMVGLRYVKATLQSEFHALILR